MVDGCRPSRAAMPPTGVRASTMRKRVRRSSRSRWRQVRAKGGSEVQSLGEVGDSHLAIEPCPAGSEVGTNPRARARLLARSRPALFGARKVGRLKTGDEDGEDRRRRHGQGPAGRVLPRASAAPLLRPRRGRDRAAGRRRAGPVVTEASGGGTRPRPGAGPRPRSSTPSARDPAEASGAPAETRRGAAAAIAPRGAFARPAPTPVPDAPRRRLAGLPAYRRRLPAETAARARRLGHPRTPAPAERARAALDRPRRERAELDAPAAGAVEAGARVAAGAAPPPAAPGGGPVLGAALLAEPAGSARSTRAGSRAGR